MSKNLTGSGAGRIPDKERVRRLQLVDQFNREGLEYEQIAEKMNVSLSVVKRLQIYLANLESADLTPTILGKKRSEIYLELSEASAEARALFFKYKEPIKCKKCNGKGLHNEKMCSNCKGLGKVHSTLDANRFFQSWLAAIEKKAKLYGLDSIRSDTTLQQFNFHGDKGIPEMKVSNKASKTLSDILKAEHEEALSNK